MSVSHYISYLRLLADFNSTDERNQLNMGLFNIKLQSEELYKHATEGSTIVIDKENMTVRIDGNETVFQYEQSPIEQTLLQAGGVLPLYNLWGREVFRQVTSSKPRVGIKKDRSNGMRESTQRTGKDVLAW